MQVILMDESERYLYPQGIESLEQFIDSLQNNKNSFVHLEKLLEDNCVAPYFIKEETKFVYLHISAIRTISCEEVSLFSREEYDKKLTDVVERVCVSCKSYEQDIQGDNLSGHRDTLRLDGTCLCYYKKDEV